LKSKRRLLTEATILRLLEPAKRLTKPPAILGLLAESATKRLAESAHRLTEPATESTAKSAHRWAEAAAKATASA
jgi:hypothetical protein